MQLLERYKGDGALEHIRSSDDVIFAGKIQNISRYETTLEKPFYRSNQKLRETQTIPSIKKKSFLVWASFRKILYILKRPEVLLFGLTPCSNANRSC